MDVKHTSALPVQSSSTSSTQRKVATKSSTAPSVERGKSVGTPGEGQLALRTSRTSHTSAPLPTVHSAAVTGRYRTDNGNPISAGEAQHRYGQNVTHRKLNLVDVVDLAIGRMDMFKKRPENRDWNNLVKLWEGGQTGPFITMERMDAGDRATGAVLGTRPRIPATLSLIPGGLSMVLTACGHEKIGAYVGFGGNLGLAMMFTPLISGLIQIKKVKVAAAQKQGDVMVGPEREKSPTMREINAELKDVIAEFETLKPQIAALSPEDRATLTELNKHLASMAKEEMSSAVGHVEDVDAGDDDVNIHLRELGQVVDTAFDSGAASSSALKTVATTKKEPSELVAKLHTLCLKFDKLNEHRIIREADASRVVSISRNQAWARYGRLVALAVVSIISSYVAYTSKYTTTHPADSTHPEPYQVPLKVSLSWLLQVLATVVYFAGASAMAKRDEPARMAQTKRINVMIGELVKEKESPEEKIASLMEQLVPGMAEEERSKILGKLEKVTGIKDYGTIMAMGDEAVQNRIGAIASTLPIEKETTREDLVALRDEIAAEPDYDKQLESVNELIDVHNFRGQIAMPETNSLNNVQLIWSYQAAKLEQDIPGMRDLASKTQAQQKVNTLKSDLAHLKAGMAEKEGTQHWDKISPGGWGQVAEALDERNYVDVAKKVADVQRRTPADIISQTSQGYFSANQAGASSNTVFIVGSLVKILTTYGFEEPIEAKVAVSTFLAAMGYVVNIPGGPILIKEKIDERSNLAKEAKAKAPGSVQALGYQKLAFGDLKKPLPFVGKTLKLVFKNYGKGFIIVPITMIENRRRGQTAGTEAATSLRGQLYGTDVKGKGTVAIPIDAPEAEAIQRDLQTAVSEGRAKANVEATGDEVAITIDVEEEARAT